MGCFSLSLTQGQVTIVDDDDFERLSKNKWQARRDKDRGFYAERMEYAGHKTPYRIGMAREILGLGRGDPRIADHINGDTLDNRKCNLRIVDHSQNMQNRKLGKNSSSGLRGVCWHRRDKRWTAYIKHRGKRVHLGYFKTKEQAYGAYCAAAEKMHGEYRRTEKHES